MTEPPYDETNKMNVRPAKTQISLGIHPVRTVFSIRMNKTLGSFAIHWARSKDFDQAGRTYHFTVMSLGGSLLYKYFGLVAIEPIHSRKIIRQSNGLVQVLVYVW